MQKLKHLFNKFLPEITLACNSLFIIALLSMLYNWFIYAQMPDLFVSGFLFLALLFGSIGLILDSVIKIRDRK